MSILSHRWGQSAAEDQIWAEVSGYGPRIAGGWLLMSLQAVIDDSQDAGGVYVLAGYIASAEAWAQFAREWERLLPMAVMGKSGKYRFKMSEMAATEERMSRVPAFYRVIEEHVQASISAKIYLPDLRRVQARIFAPGLDIDWGLYANPYFITFRCLMDKFHSERPRITEWFPEDQKIDFYFDNQAEKGAIAAMWDNYIAEREDKIKRFYGAAPSFRNDEEFLPLQAADFWAWWVRKWYRDGTPEKIQKWEFDDFEPARTRKHLRIEISFDQDALMKTMMQVLRTHIGPNKPIIDLRGLDAL